MRSKKAPLRLGDFELLERVGEGGMGEVWRGRHLPSGDAAAVKVLSRRGSSWLNDRLFRREIAAASQLDHPNVVPLDDFGYVPSHLGRSMDRSVEPGAPWLAMPFIEGGSLASAGPPADFGRIRAVLLDVLSGLAHAHAHGIVHRDVKPDNVLLAADGRALVSDFGIAQSARSSGEARSATEGVLLGTIDFMAPEQLAGRRAAIGPATDLYAVGILAWWLCTGRYPFRSADGGEVARAALERQLPAFRPRVPVPAEFEPWLCALASKAPRDRPPNAAAALRGLGAMSPARGSTSGAPPSARDPAPSTLVAPRIGIPSAPELSLGRSARPSRWGAPPARVPSDWRALSRAEQRPRAAAANPRMFRARHPSFVGRDAERDRLWSCFARALEGSELRVVVVCGEPGSGRSALLRWLARNVAEHGLAQTVVAQCDGARGMEGWRRGLVRALGGPWPDPVAASGALLRAGVDVADAAAMAAWLQPTESAAGPMLRPPLRSDLVSEHALRALGGPAVLLLDDADESPRVLELVLGAARSSSNVRVLVVASRAPLELPDAEVVRLGDSAELIEAVLRRALPLSDSDRQDTLAALPVRVAPALRELGDRLYSGELGWHDGGFGTGPAWRDAGSEARSFLSGLRPTEVGVVATAARLGFRFVESELKLVCEADGRWYSSLCTAKLAEAGLAADAIEGALFACAKVREELLEQTAAMAPPTDALRAGLLAAGTRDSVWRATRLDGACASLPKPAVRLLRALDPADAARFVASLPAGDEVTLLKRRLRWLGVDCDEPSATDTGPGALLAESERLALGGERVAAAERAEHAVDAYRAAGDDRGAAWATLWAARAWRTAGNPGRAAMFAERARGRLTRLGAPGAEAWATLARGLAHAALGSYAAAAPLLQAARAELRASGFVGGESDALQGLVQVAESRGEERRAARYRRDHARLESWLRRPAVG